MCDAVAALRRGGWASEAAALLRGSTVEKTRAGELGFVRMGADRSGGGAQGGSSGEGRFLQISRWSKVMMVWVRAWQWREQTRARASVELTVVLSW
jgi:hypothetical protein